MLVIATVFSLCTALAPQAPLARSIDEKRRFLDAMELVAKDTKDPEARRAVRFFSANLVAAAPSGPMAFISEQLPKAPSQPIYFVPLQRSDASHGGLWLERLLEGAFAEYEESNRLLLIRADQPISPFFFGLLGHHEAFHILHPLPEAAEEEREAYLYAHRLLRAKGGWQYRRLLREIVGGFEARRRKKIAGALQLPEGALVRLEAALNPRQRPGARSRSLFEDRLREHLLYLDAVFSFFDRAYGKKEAAAHKADYLRNTPPLH